MDPQSENIFKSLHSQLEQGQIAQVRERLNQLEPTAAGDHALLQHIAEFYVLCGQHADAVRCYEQAANSQPKNPRYLYNLASAKIAMGDLAEAEELLNQVIRLDPFDHDAWQNRSTLRTQTSEKNHVEELKFVLSKLDENDPGRVPVCFALAKELEDLEQFDEAWAYLQQGAVTRRRGMAYRVEDDEAAMGAIAEAFDKVRLNHHSEKFESERPVFVLGMPRSGTTLVDRILNAHSEVESVGENNLLALSVVACTKKSPDKMTLIRNTANIQFEDLGRRYCEGVAGYGLDSNRLVDKTPLNFLYIGLIHLALSGARIIHLRRNPLDSCYAMYKTLFRLGFPFTYSLQDVGRYFIAYRRLMDHWRTCLPGRFLDVDYENLVTDQENQTRRLLDYCGLDFEPACLAFHKQKSASATASAAQVRKPIYSTSVGRWRCYERQLTPLALKLREHGIGVDS